MGTKARLKQTIAVWLSAALILTGMQLPASAAVTEKTGTTESSYTAPVLPASSSDAKADLDHAIRPLIIDQIPPIITGAKLLTTQVSNPGYITLELDLIEDGYGVSAILAGDLWGGPPYAVAVFPEPLFTGRHIVELELQSGMVEAGETYEIEVLRLYDSFGGSGYEYSTFEADWPFSEPAVFTVVSDHSGPPLPTCRLNGIRFLSEEIYVSDYLRAELDMADIGSGISWIQFYFKETETGLLKSVVWDQDDSKNTGVIQPGRNSISFYADLPAGTYELAHIFFFEDNNTYREYNKYATSEEIESGVSEPWTFDDLVISVTGETDQPPEISRVKIINTNIHAPGTLDLELDITAGNGGVTQIAITLTGDYTDEIMTTVLLPYKYVDGGELQIPEQSTLQTGTHVLHFPIPLDMLPDTDYYLTSIELVDRKGQYNGYYSGHGQEAILAGLPPVRLTRNHYAIETSVWNPELPSLLAAMPAGSEVLLESGDKQMIPASVFAAAAGRDITINVELSKKPYYLPSLFTFNGKAIRAADARDVKLAYLLHFVPGQEYGLADETIYLLKLEDRGRLPGPITFRFPTSGFLLTEDSYDANAMYLSRVSGTSLIRQDVVSEGTDGYTNLVLTSGADYVLSKTKPADKHVGGSSGGSSGGSLANKVNRGNWKQDDGGWWYQYQNGSYAASAWEQIGGSWYYFEASGYMATGWKMVNGAWYWMDPESGKMASGNWVFDGANWYYLGRDGAMVTGWLLDKDAYYYLSEVSGSTYGKMLSNDVTPDGYQVDQNGVWIP